MRGMRVWGPVARCRAGDRGRCRARRVDGRARRAGPAPAVRPEPLRDLSATLSQATTRVMAAGAGGRSIWARPAPTSRQPRRGSTAREHGVVVAAVPWARHGAGHTRAFDDTVAWLATPCSKSAVGALTRVARRTVAGDHQPRRRRRPGRPRSARRVDPDRDRRDRLPEGPALSDGRRRPRQRPPGVGRRGAERADPGALLRRAR